MLISLNNINAGNGGVFGEAFDSDLINYSSYGDLEIIFSGGENRSPPIGLHNIERTAAVKFTDTDGNKLRTNLQQLSFLSLRLLKTRRMTPHGQDISRATLSLKRLGSH